VREQQVFREHHCFFALPVQIESTPAEARARQLSCA